MSTLFLVFGIFGFLWQGSFSNKYDKSFKDLSRIPGRRDTRQFNLFQYNSFKKIDEYLEKLAKSYPEFITLATLGNSSEGRRMKLVKISSNKSAGNPIIFIDAGIHSREWVAPAMAVYLINRLVTDSSARDNELNGVDWYILPVVNPDGYEYTRSNQNNRMWRKTRSKHGKCYGVDGNRNFGYKWAVSGVSHDPCNKEVYAGPKPFSEPETNMVGSVMLENSNRIKLYVSLHSFGQSLVYPWGYTGSILPRTWEKMDSLARTVSDKVQQAGGKPFKVYNAGKDPAAGGSDDYAFSLGIPYSYTMELTEGYQFAFPDHLLHIVLPQFYEGFRAFGKHIKAEYGRR